MMKRIITVQDMIDELMLVVNKDAEINIVMNTGDYQTEYIPDLYDFSVIDFTDVHPDDGNSSNKHLLSDESLNKLLNMSENKNYCKTNPYE